MSFHKSNCSLEWELSNFDPFVRCHDLKFDMSDDPPMASWFNFNWFIEL